MEAIKTHIRTGSRFVFTDPSMRNKCDQMDLCLLLFNYQCKNKLYL